MTGAKKTGPTYPLSDVVRLATVDGSRFVTASATSDSAELLGIAERSEIFRIVASLKPSHFYKTMQATQSQGLWQDVYLPTAAVPRFQGGVVLYCKVQINNSGALVVISFKPK